MARRRREGLTGWKRGREGGSRAAGEALKVSLAGIAAEPRTREKESGGTDAEALRRKDEDSGLSRARECAHVDVGGGGGFTSCFSAARQTGASPFPPPRPFPSSPPARWKLSARQVSAGVRARLARVAWLGQRVGVAGGGGSGARAWSLPPGTKAPTDRPTDGRAGGEEEPGAGPPRGGGPRGLALRPPPGSSGAAPGR